MDVMQQKSCPTFWVRIYLSGPIEVAKQVIRAECMRAGLCVTIEPTHYIYTGGEETGYVVGLANYPRFPSTQAEIVERARGLALKLLAATHQHSAMIMSPLATEWMSTRETP